MTGSVWLYLSIYLFMPLAPLLMVDRRQLIGYGIGMATIALFAAIVFVLWPTFCHRPLATNANFAYRSLIAVDNSYHAFPSLHAAFTMFSLLCAIRLIRELHVSWFWTILLWLWAALILFATLATKQHVIIDLLAGSVLALAIYPFTVGTVASPKGICSNALIGAGSTINNYEIEPTTRHD